jgi:hypothetical protein
MESCLSCKFTLNKDGGSLSCQRYPSQLRVARSGWCGEWTRDVSYTIPAQRTKERVAKVKAAHAPTADLLSGEQP